MRFFTGTRVPTNTGVPCMISGWLCTTRLGGITLRSYAGPKASSMDARGPGSPCQMKAPTSTRSSKRVDHLDSRFREIAPVSGDDREAMNERRRRDQTVLDRHGLAQRAKLGEKLEPNATPSRPPTPGSGYARLRLGTSAPIARDVSRSAAKGSQSGFRQGSRDPRRSPAHDSPANRALCDPVRAGWLR